MSTYLLVYFQQKLFLKYSNHWEFSQIEFNILLNNKMKLNARVCKFCIKYILLLCYVVSVGFIVVICCFFFNVSMRLNSFFTNKSTEQQIQKYFMKNFLRENIKFRWTNKKKTSSYLSIFEKKTLESSSFQQNTF